MMKATPLEWSGWAKPKHSVQYAYVIDSLHPKSRVVKLTHNGIEELPDGEQLAASLEMTVGEENKKQ